MATVKWEFLFMSLMLVELSSASDFLRVCYFPSWARYRTNTARYEVGDIDPFLCTHVIYAFGKLNQTSRQLTAFEAWAEEGQNGKYSQFIALKQSNPSLKTMISIGGQNDHSDGFVAITQTDDVLQNFATSTVTFLRNRGFDGLDIDWEYPNITTRTNLVRLLKELRNAFNADTVSPKLLLSMAGPAGQWNIDPGFDVPEIAKYVDFANLMTYDYTVADAKVASFNSPLFSRNDPRFNPTLSTNWTTHYWNSLGLPFSKIVVGITGVGRRLVLQSVTNTAPGSNVTGEVRRGQYYSIDAGLAYPEICEMLANPSTMRTFDQEQKNPYLVSADNWVGYEDKESIGIKVQWMKDLKVAGLMFWSLDQDDFTGRFCNDGKYPLLNVVLSKTTTVTPAPQTTKSPQTTPKATPRSPDTKDEANDEFLRVCYFPSWARYRGGPGRYEVGDIDPTLCTHLIYAFGKLDRTSRQLTALEPSSEDGPAGKFSQFTDLKKSNPGLKTLISIGGQNDYSDGFQAVTQTDQILQNFADTTVKFLRERAFDGLDVDWEYPSTNDKSTFVRLLQALRSAFDADTSGPRLLLTFAGPAGQWNIDPGYDVPEIAKYVDYALLMTYDYTDKSAKVTAFNSPLYSRNDPRFNSQLSTNWTTHYWNSLGLPFSKIVVGFTGVGRRLVLQNVTNTAPGSNVTGEVRKGRYYSIDAGLAYPEICEMLSNSSSTRTFDVEQANPYLVNGDDWVGYEDKESLNVKIQWMKELQVAGIMFWSLDQDDFTGQFCGEGRYPLLNLIKAQTSLNTTTTTVATTAAPTPTSTTETTTAAPTSTSTTETTTAAPTPTSTTETTTAAPTPTSTTVATTAAPTSTSTTVATTAAPTSTSTTVATTAAPTSTSTTVATTAAPTSTSTTVATTAAPTSTSTTVATTAAPTPTSTTVATTAARGTTAGSTSLTIPTTLSSAASPVNTTASTPRVDSTSSDESGGNISPLLRGSLVTCLLVALVSVQSIFYY